MQAGVNGSTFQVAVMVVAGSGLDQELMRLGVTWLRACACACVRGMWQRWIGRQS